MRWKTALTRLALALLPLLPLATFTVKPLLRGILALTASAALLYIVYVKRKPVVFLEGEGGEWTGCAGAWAIKAWCRLFDRDPLVPVWDGTEDVVAVGNLDGYETKVCRYKYYMFREPGMQLLQDVEGAPAKPGFRTGHRMPLFRPTSKLRDERMRFRGTVSWSTRGEASAIYWPGERERSLPEPIKVRFPPEQAHLLLTADPVGAAEEMASYLLSIARPSPTRGGVRVGREQGGGIFYLPDGHIGVFGMTGSGKTSLLLNITLRTKDRVWLIDFTGEYSVLAERGFEVVEEYPNPLERLSPGERLELLERASVLVYGERGEFSPIVAEQLYDVLRQTGDIGEIIGLLDSKMKKARDRDVYAALAAARRRLMMLEETPFTGGSEWGDRVVFDLSGLPEMAQILAANAILEEAYSRGGMTVIVDEAHRISRRLSGRETLIPALEKILREARSRGIRVVLADQYSGWLPPSLLSQLTIFWMHYESPPPTPDVLRERVMRLRRGEALVAYKGAYYTVFLDPPELEPGEKIGSYIEKLAKKVSLDELERFLRGEEVSRELVEKLRRLGLVRGSRLNARGKAVYEFLKGKY